MNIDVILLLYIHFSALSNSINFKSPLKSHDSRLKILINEGLDGGGGSDIHYSLKF